MRAGCRASSAVAQYESNAVDVFLGNGDGTLQEANELMTLARAGKITPLPIEERPLAAAQQSLDDLRAGRVVGRVSLVT